MSAMFNRNPMGGLPTYRKNTGLNIIFSIISLALAAYLINLPFGFFTVPEFILKLEKWIIFAGGIFVLIGLINFFRASRNSSFQRGY